MDEDEAPKEQRTQAVEAWDDECRRWIEAAYRYEMASHHRVLRP